MKILEDAKFWVNLVDNAYLTNRVPGSTQKHYKFSAGTIYITIYTEGKGNLLSIALWLPNKFEIIAQHGFPRDFVFDHYLMLGDGASVGYQPPEKIVINKKISDDEFEQLLTILVLELT